MRKNRPTRRSRSNGFARLFGATTPQLRRAPRRRTLELLEPRQVMSANVGGNPYFEDQWNLDANGQQTEFDPTSPTRDQTLAVIDNNVIEAWEQLVTGAGVQIGVIAGGFDLSHEDLVGAFATELAYDAIGSFAGGTLGILDTNPAIEPDFFDTQADIAGTAVSGIIGARNNDVGVVGIAYEADIVPIRAISNAFQNTFADENMIASALRWRMGMVQDSNGDGVVDGVDNDGDGVIDGFAADEVIDVYFVSSEVNNNFGDNDGVFSRDVNRLPDAVRAAIEDGANGGRARWDDIDGDGIFDLEEVTALGAIYVVPAGNDNGVAFDIADQTGFDSSSQYNELANSRYTIAVGAVDSDGRYENNATGLVTSFAEIGPNVLLVAPSGTDQIDLASDGDLNSGILTTDVTGAAGNNALADPLFGEVDGDFFPDPNYTSTFGGTEAAAAQVTAVIGQMLEANPDLSRRDVEQILLMSAQQVDQFSETWVTNPFSYFAAELSYVAPQWVYYDIDTDGDGEADIEDAILPNSPLINLEAFDQDVVRGYFINNPDLTVPNYGLVDITDIPTDDMGNTATIISSNLPIGLDDQINPERLFVYPQGLGGLNEDFRRIGVDDLLSPASLTDIPLLFENGVGYTVSSGYGTYLEEIGFAHGLLDAGLAVELAKAWLPTDEFGSLTKPQEISISTPIQDGAGNTLALQGRADFTINNTPNVTFTVPGGQNVGAINGAFYTEFAQPIETETIDFEGDFEAEVITNAPFYDPDGNQTFTLNRGSSFYPVTFSEDIDTDFLSAEWFEFRASFTGGDVDHIRVSLLSPDGTQTELNPYRLPSAAFDSGLEFQQTQFGQQFPVPGTEVLESVIGLGGGAFFEKGGVPTTFDDGAEIIEIGGGEYFDALASGETYTWTTNRHYGELVSTQASPAGGFSGFGISDERLRPDDTWYVVVENWGPASGLDGVQITVHGTEATGQRIQGKVGIDDNRQNTDFWNIPLQPGGTTAANPTPEQLGDGVFNFERYVEFGEIIIDEDPQFDPITGIYLPNLFAETVTVVVDDTTDSVDFDKLNDPFTDRVYRTRDRQTGEETTYPIVDLESYLSGDVGALQSQLTQFDSSLSGAYVTPAFRKSDGTISLDGLSTGTPSTFRNFDINQDSFAAGATVVATQYRVTYDTSGNPVSRAETGIKQRFVTGADGNYYFDVDATPAPPDATADPAGYANWFNDFGFTLEYDVTVVNEDSRLWDREYTLDDQDDPRSQVQYNGGGAYTVQLFDGENIANGETTTVRDVNFLLAVDLADVLVTVNGSIVQDIDENDAVRGPTDGTYEGVRVYHDANNNNAFDVGEMSVLSAADGTYELMFDPTGDETASIRLDPTTYPEPVREVAPLVMGEAELVLNNLEAGDEFTQDFFLKPTASFVLGSVWQDANQNRRFDLSEAGFDGTLIGRDGTEVALFVYEDANGNALFDVGEQRSAVSADGTYALRFDTPGDYTIRLDLTNADVSQTFPSAGTPQIVSVTAEQTLTDVNFGVKDLRVFDFGDLPDSYGTLLGSDGARHRVGTTTYLGARLPDVELDGQSTFNADGDDNDGIDDEDGVTFVTGGVTAGGTLEFDIVANGGGAVLNAWVDFNNDGVFDASEQIFDDVGNLGTGTPIRIEATANGDVVAADRYAARFRWGPFGLGPTGPANDGEVEDLWLTPDAIVVSGSVRLDADNDAIFENADTPRQGVRVFIDENLDGIRNPNEPSNVTDAAGNYTFNVVPDGIDTPITIRVEESTLGINVGFLNPASGIIADLGDPGEQITANFLLTSLPRPTQVITGSIFADLNNNGLVDTGENGLEGIEVELLRNVDADPAFEVVATALTNPSGVYSFPANDTGQYEVRVALPAGSTQQVSTTGGDARDVAVQTGQTVTVPAFGLFDIRTTYTRDYGDLRVGGGDNYPTTAIQGGPSHLVDGINFLGTSVDVDSGQLTSVNASADDIDFTDDEDGVVLLSSEIVAGEEISFNVTATGDASSRLNVWIDFDDNGIFDADEQIVTDLGLASGATTRINRVAPADTSTTAALLATRVRWGTAGVGSDDADLTDEQRDAIVGEVEDLLFPTSQPGSVTGPSLIVGDFNGNGIVSEADRAVWRDSYGATGADLPADANGDGRVDLADFTIWRDAMAAPALALATAGDGDTSEPAPAPALATAIPQPVQMPIVETEPEPVFEPASFDAGAFAPLTLVDPRTASAIDESLSVEDEDADETGDAFESALLEWSLEGPAAGDEGSEVESLTGGDDDEVDAADEDALAAAFAL